MPDNNGGGNGHGHDNGGILGGILGFVGGIGKWLAALVAFLGLGGCGCLGVSAVVLVVPIFICAFASIMLDWGAAAYVGTPPRHPQERVYVTRGVHHHGPGDAHTVRVVHRRRR